MQANIIKTEIMEMTQTELSALTDQELLAEAKKMKSTSIANALLIGFALGVIVFSIVKSTVGLFTLIPLFFVFKMLNKPNQYEDLKGVLKERGLR